jgi:hypothetical protein
MCLDEVGAAACKEYIQDEMVHFDGLRIWGTPLSRPYEHGGEKEEGDVLGKNKAFQTNTFARVASIPEAGVDVLITHGAPRGILDTINGSPVGCPVLLRKVQQLRPRLHIFGHVHCQGGARVLVDQGTVYVNASNLGDFAPKDDGTSILYPPVVIDLPKPPPPRPAASSIAAPPRADAEVAAAQECVADALSEALASAQQDEEAASDSIHRLQAEVHELGARLGFSQRAIA